MSTLSISAVIESIPADFPFSSCLIALLVSSMVGSSVLISYTSILSVFSSLTGLSGSFLFKISLKCSFHLSTVSALPLINFPSLSSIVVPLLNFPSLLSFFC